MAHQTSRRTWRALTRGVAALAVSAAVTVSAPAAQAQDTRDYLLATASTGGTYYPVGVAIATLIKVRLQNSLGINMNAINSAGSAENVRLLRNGEAQFAILQGLYGYYARTGSGPMEEDGPQENLRSISMLWQNVEQFAMAADSAETGTIADMRSVVGEAVALGRSNSGTIGSNRVLMANLGINIDEDYELFDGGYGPSGEALQNGQVVAISTPAGVPTSAVTQTFAAMGDDVVMLDITDEQLEEMNGDIDLWTRFVIPAGTYPNQDADILTIAQPNFLAVSADVSEDDVYEMTRTMFENLAFLRGIHPATEVMSLETALAGLPLPLHPGALRYFEEQGLEIPDNLRP